MLSFYGYNELDKRLSDDLLLAINPAVMLVFDAGRASHLCDLLPDCEVYYRSWTPDPVTGDDALSNRQGADTVDPVARAEFMHAACPDPRIWLIPENEPRDEPYDPGDADFTRRHVKWQLACANRLLALGRKVGIGKYGPGGPTATRPTPRGNVVDWQGALRPLAELANDNPDRVRMVLDEYIYHFDIRYGYDPAWHRYWYAGRCWMLLNEFPNAKVMLGECGADDLDWRYKGPFFSPHSPGKQVLTPGEYVDLLEQAYRELYAHLPDNVIGGAIFCYGNNGGRWLPWDMSGVDRGVLVDLAERTRKPGRVNMESMQEMRVTVLAPGGVRKRLAPGGPVLGGEMIDDGVYLVSNPVEETLESTTYVWRRFSRNGAVWWSATGPLDNPAQYIALRPLDAPEPEPEPPPAPEPAPAPDPMTPERWAVLMGAWLDAVDAAIDALTAFRGVLVETMEAMEQEDGRNGSR